MSSQITWTTEFYELSPGANGLPDLAILSIRELSDGTIATAYYVPSDSAAESRVVQCPVSSSDDAEPKAWAETLAKEKIAAYWRAARTAEGRKDLTGPVLKPLDDEKRLAARIWMGYYKGLANVRNHTDSTVIVDRLRPLRTAPAGRITENVFPL